MWASSHVRELKVHHRRLAGPGRGLRKAVAFLSDSNSGHAGDLRAMALEPHLAKLGWRMISVPPHLDLAQRRRLLAIDKPELILLQQSRHPLNRPRLYEGIPCVFDADDADIVDPRCTELVVECCRDSASIIAGSHFLADEFRPYNPNVTVIWTGTYLTRIEGGKAVEERRPVLTWAHSSPLGYPQEANLIREVLVRLASRTKFSFDLYGIDEHQEQRAMEYLGPIREAGVPVRTFEPMPYGAFIRSLGSAAVGLHPVCVSSEFSRGKSFGKLLAYLAADAAIVTTDAVDHPRFFRDGDNGMLISNDVDTWVDRCERLLTQPELRRRMVEAARADFLRLLTTEQAAERVAEQFDRAVELSKTRVVGLANVSPKA
jgi:hypothetical protein